MKEKKTVRERTIVIDIKLTRRLVVALSCILVVVGLLTYLTLTGESAAASGETSPAQSSGMRQYYLTDFPEGSGGTARTACAPGYHMASLWELVDPSNLKYNNTSLGFARSDSGQGPPSEEWGWVRTGYTAESSNTQTPGRANCDGWTSSSSGLYGTVANLPENWTSGDQDMEVWNVVSKECSYMRRVWCIED